MLRLKDELKPKSKRFTINVTDMKMVHSPTSSAGKSLRMIGSSNAVEATRKKVAKKLHTTSTFDICINYSFRIVSYMQIISI